MKTLNILRIKTSGTVEQVEIHKIIEDMQAEVDGYIECAYSDILDEYDLLMVVNEEGVIKSLPLNAKASRLCSYPIFGDVFLARAGEEEFEDFPAELEHTIEAIISA